MNRHETRLKQLRQEQQMAQQHIPIGGAIDLEQKKQQELLREAQINSAIINLATQMFATHFHTVIENKISARDLAVLAIQGSRILFEENLKEEQKMMNKMRGEQDADVGIG